MTSFIRFDR